MVEFHCYLLGFVYFIMIRQNMESAMEVERKERLSAAEWGGANCSQWHFRWTLPGWRM